MTIDELYVKPHLTFQGANVFRKVITDQKKYATTVLSYMICSLFGGKKIHSVPIFGLYANFQYGQAVGNISIIKKTGCVLLELHLVITMKSSRNSSTCLI